MITPATIATAPTTPTATPTVAPPVNPLLSVFPVGVAVVPPEVAPTAVPVAVPVAVLVPVPVLATVDSELLVEVLPILVENTDGVESGTVVPIDLLGNALYCFDAASIGFTPEFGEANVPTQTLIWPGMTVHVS